MIAPRVWHARAGAFQRRAALGLRPFAAPITLFLPLGIALGPLGAGIISERGLVHLDVVVTIALGTLGVFIGAAAARQPRTMRRLFAASAVEAGLTIVIVSAAVFVLLRVWGAPVTLPVSVVAFALGVAAATSAAPAVLQSADRRYEIAARVADLDDVLPILLGGTVLGAATLDRSGGLLTAAVAVGVGLGVGVSGWLLFERAQDPGERGVFVLGAIALLGGSAAFVGGSPLVAGLAAGWFWVVAPGQADHLIARDLGKIQHPLVVLLLVTAGATIKPTLLGVWLLVPYVTFRICGKLIGGWAASRIADRYF